MSESNKLSTLFILFLKRSPFYDCVCIRIRLSILFFNEYKTNSYFKRLRHKFYVLLYVYTKTYNIYVFAYIIFILLKSFTIDVIFGRTQLQNSYFTIMLFWTDLTPSISAAISPALCACSAVSTNPLSCTTPL